MSHLAKFPAQLAGRQQLLATFPAKSKHREIQFCLKNKHYLL